MGLGLNAWLHPKPLFYILIALLKDSKGILLFFLHMGVSTNGVPK